MTAADVLAAVTAGDLPRLDAILVRAPHLAAARDEHGVSAILHARYRGGFAIVDRLVAAAPALDVFEAAALGRLDRVRELVEAEPALAAAFSPDGFTALHLAAFFGHPETAGWLIDRGAEADAVARNRMRVTPLHAAAAGRHAAIVGRLVAAGANVNARQHGGFTPLHSAAQNRDDESRAILLRAGADPTLRTDDGRSADDIAGANGAAG